MSFKPYTILKTDIGPMISESRTEERHVGVPSTLPSTDYL